MKLPLFAAVLCAFVSSASATIIQFDLQGTSGFGLLPGNEPAGTVTTASTGSGGEIGAGISFNDATLVLTVNVGWGTGNNFTDLTSAVMNSHIHGPVTLAQASTFTGTTAVLFNLARVSSTANGGSIATTQSLTAPQATELLAGRYYINIHTMSNGGGEARGFLVQAVPEPGTAGLIGCGALAFFARRRRG